MILTYKEFTIRCDSRNCQSVIKRGTPDVKDKKSMAVFASEYGWLASNSVRTPDKCPLCQGNTPPPVPTEGRIQAHPMAIDREKLNAAVARILEEDAECVI